MDKKVLNIPSDYVEVKELNQMQSLLIYLMGCLHEICEENNIRYNIFGGTMLGAVRHKGIIPWDDDIDITMPRPDYERFVDLIRSDYNNDYEMLDPTMPNYCYPFAKFTLKDTILIEDTRKQYSVIKLYIDVFPVDGYPQKEEPFFRRLKWYKFLRGNLVHEIYLGSGIDGLVKYVGKILLWGFSSIWGMARCVRAEVEQVKQNDFETSEYVLCQGAGWNQKGKLKKNIYLNRRLYDFNNIRVWGISDYHEHLTTLYGNYMELPPEEKRIAVHNYSLFVKKSIVDGLEEKI